MKEEKKRKDEEEEKKMKKLMTTSDHASIHPSTQSSLQQSSTCLAQR